MRSLKKKHASENEWAAEVLSTATGTPPPTDLIERMRQRLAERAGKNPAAVALGTLGGLKGGIARAEALTAKERTIIATKAAESRWAMEAKVKAGLEHGVGIGVLADKLGISMVKALAMQARILKQQLREAQVSKSQKPRRA